MLEREQLPYRNGGRRKMDITLKNYIEGVLQLDIVKKLYVLRESRGNIVLVSATSVFDNTNFMRRAKILDKEFLLQEKELFEQIEDLKKTYIVDIELIESTATNPPYQSKVYVVSLTSEE